MMQIVTCNMLDIHTSHSFWQYLSHCLFFVGEDIYVKVLFSGESGRTGAVENKTPYRKPRFELLRDAAWKTIGNSKLYAHEIKRNWKTWSIFTREKCLNLCLNKFF